jgi:hypothetical protein
LSPKADAFADQDNHPMRKHSSAWAASLALTWILSACTPAQNWRDIGFEGSALKVQLPCKPDRTTRAVPLGGVSVDLQVAGCESETAMVAVMTASLPIGSDATAVLSGWQKATLDNARVPSTGTDRQPQTWHRPGHLPLTSSQRVQAMGLKSSGEPVAIDAVWGAVTEGDRVRLVHAVVYDRKILPEMANTLFESIKP